MAKNPSVRPPYEGPIQAIVFDWAGTIIDFGSCAPAAAFIETFRRAGVEITPAEAREPMGRAKRDHIQALLAMPAVAERWQSRHGAAPCEMDIDRLYADFQPIQFEVLATHAELIPGVVETVHWLRARGIKIGSSTGYSHVQTDVLVDAARRQGLQIDCVVCAEDVAAGRPAPWMLLENARRLNVYPWASIVKVDDTPVGIEAGVHAGAVAVGVTRSGNELGLTAAEVARLPAGELAERLAAAEQRMFAAGADYVIETVAELPAVITAISD